ncbi:MAG TPA: META domain-containing protein [Caulobacteraceae bacterium]|nr:META domain-containing protein [Caulobacteraceae bacterium]
MTKIWIVALAALTLAACEEQPRETSIWGPVPPAQGPEKPPARVDTSFMQGEWRLATLGTYPPESPTKVTITADRVDASMSCKRYAWTYVMTEQRFEATKAAPVEASCERNATMWERALEETFTRANTVEMQVDGGLYIKGAGGEMELKR